MLKDIIRLGLTGWFALSIPLRRARIKLTRRARFCLGRVKSDSRSNGLTLDGRMQQCQITFRGKDNLLVNHGTLTHTDVTIEGRGNELIIGDKSQLSYSKIFLRGNHCRIKIGERTDIGGVYLVCQGRKNRVEIGSDCLFSSDIDLWASDTHELYDETGKVINPSVAVKVGDRVWLGRKVCILKGTHIGEDCVVGMGTLLPGGSYPAKSVIIGNPGRVVRENISWSKKLVDCD